MRRTITFRSRLGRIGTLVVAALAGLLEIVVLVQEGWRPALVGLPLPLAVVLLCAWLWWWPRLTTGPGGVLVRNHFREVWIPWTHLQDAHTRLGLRLVADGHTYVSATPPERGGFAAGRKRRAGLSLPDLDDTRTVHHEVDTVPEGAARMLLEERELALHPERRPRLSTAQQEKVTQRLEESPIPDRLDAGFPQDVQVKWTPLPALVVAALFALTVLSFS
ncbi:PH domain-containing protein [Actinomyces polynesiensis]|uniref:PH domain-containing protein n=1 Tax=Actinomyces polynesiensis TaxID=1325934 RepID=UPI0005BB30CF|nr:PH domain-containing protein [Actinomyces polynesiensis]